MVDTLQALSAAGGLHAGSRALHLLVLLIALDALLLLVLAGVLAVEPAGHSSQVIHYLSAEEGEKKEFPLIHEPPP